MSICQFNELPQQELILKFVKELDWKNWTWIQYKGEIPWDMVVESEDAYAMGLECLKYLWAHPDVPPVMAIENFANDMNKQSVELPPEIGRLYSIGHDVAMNLLDIMIGT